MGQAPSVSGVVSPDIPLHERGYALVAAVASIAFFALIAAAVLASAQRASVAGSADIGAARVAAAADAGIALAVSGLLANDLAARWTIDGQRRTVMFEGVRLDIAVVDERGKVPLNLLESGSATDLFEALGLAGENLRIARDSVLDWIDDDDEPRPDGAETGYYRRLGYAPRNGPLQTIGELGRIRGVDPSLIPRIQTFATVDFGSGIFDMRFAQPLAIAIMYGGGDATPEAIQRAREAAGQVTALGFVSEAQLIARPLEIRVIAQLGRDARTERRCVVELTGSSVRPYVIRSCA